MGKRKEEEEHLKYDKGKHGDEEFRLRGGLLMLCG